PLPGLSTAKILRAIRHELDAVIAPQLHNQREQMVLEMIHGLLAHLLIREEQLPAQYARYERRQAEHLAALMGALGSAPNPISRIDHRVDASSIEAALERTISAAIPRLSSLDPAQRDVAQRAIRSAVEREEELFTLAAAAEVSLSAARTIRAQVDDVIDEHKLTAYLRRRFGPAVQADKVTALLGGAMKDTFIAELSGANRPAAAIVIRRDSSQVETGAANSSVTHEFALLKAALEQGLPVAEPLWLDASDAFARPFLVSKRIAGSPPMNLHGRIVGTDPAQAAKGLARALAQIHCFDWSVLDGARELERLSLRQHVERMLDIWEAHWREHRVRPSPAFAAGFAWMKANIPACDVKPVLVHGDASLRNLLMQDSDITGMLDWEFWHIGDPAEDLAYCRADVEQVMPWEEFLAEYRRHGGAEYDDKAIKYYEIWPAVRIGAGCMAFGAQLADHPDVTSAVAAFAATHHYSHFVQATSRYLLGLNEFTGAEGRKP
ncbi:MAG: phosphotransferase family protein, partial [Steroidobacteraceae bacterium]